MPENIRCGVTITPPGGEPVTGTAMPIGNFITNIVGNYKQFGEWYQVGQMPPGTTLTNVSDGRWTIKGSGTISGYIAIPLTEIKFSGDYTDSVAKQGSVCIAYLPPTTLTSKGITITATTSNRGAWLFAFALVNDTGLVPSNIVEGVTINGVTGTMNSGEIVMGIETIASSTNSTMFYTTAGQTSALNDDDKPVTNIPTNKGICYYCGTPFYRTLNGNRSYVSGGTENTAVNTLSIGKCTQSSVDNYGSIIIIFN